LNQLTRITIFDATLRDGEQSPGCSMNVEEKLRMAPQLDWLGVIEVGLPIASRCEVLGFPLERRELDELYRRFVALADKVKTVENHHLLELLRKNPGSVPQAKRSQSWQVSGLEGREVPLLPDRFPL
jgi:isopropylmalate/homocitrate/citramalate synthase